jgi:predicted kinase
MEKEVIILVGNIGTGKSTITKEYVKKGYIAIARDMLRYAIGDGEYIFDLEYEPAIWRTELFLYSLFLDLDTNIIVDEVGINKQMRARYIGKAKKKGYKITAIEMPKLTMEEAVNRRLNNPHCQPDRKVWEEIWKKFDRQYESPSKDEGFDKIIKLRR